jgi:hypothetical protein
MVKFAKAETGNPLNLNGEGAVNSTYRPSRRKVLYNPPSTRAVLIWSLFLLAFMGYTIFSIEQTVCIDHCKNFVGQGVPLPSGGKLFDRDVVHTQSAADAQQRWFW